MKILLGTKNKGKIAKFGEMLNSLRIEYITPYDVDDINDLVIEEIGNTTQENAIIKAKAYYNISGMPVLCDDSALKIDKFSDDKQPGVFVHRHNGKELTDLEILDLYSKEIEGVGGESEGAFYKTIAIIDENGKLYTKEIKSPRYFVSKISNTIVENFPLRSLIYYKEYEKYMSEMTVSEAEQAEGEATKIEKEFIKSIFC